MSGLKVSTIMKYSFAGLSALALVGVTASDADAALLYGIDNSGSIWQLDTAANSGSGAFTKLTLTGTYTDTTGATIASPSIRGLTADAAGNLYTGSNSKGTLYQISLSGTNGTITRIGSTWTGINDVSTDGTNLYVGAGAGVNRVRISDGFVTEKIGGAGWDGAVAGVSVLSNNTLYYVGKAANATSSSIYSVSNAATAAGKGSPSGTLYSSTTPANVTLRDAVVFNGVVLASESDNKIVSTATLATFIDTSSLTVGSTTAAFNVYQMSVDTDLNHLFVYGIFGSQNSVFEFDSTGALVGSYATPGAWVSLTTTVAAVPEAASLSLLAIGGGALLLRRRKV